MTSQSAEFTPIHSIQGQKEAPFSVKLMRLALRIGGTYAPNLTSKKVNEIWFTPRRHDEPHWIGKLLDSADEEHRVHIRHDSVTVYSWGQGPNVLLVHGWSGRGVQLKGFIEPLVQLGYKVSLFDARAHGRSQGLQTDIVDFELTIKKIAGALGGIDTIVSHSLGSVAAMRTTLDGLAVRRLVSIASPTRLTDIVSHFSAHLQLPEHIELQHRELIEKKFGEQVWDRYAMDKEIQGMPVPGLLVHDRNDTQVGMENAELLADNWPGAELLITENLGHNRILHDADVVARIVNYIDSSL